LKAAQIRKVPAQIPSVFSGDLVRLELRMGGNQEIGNHVRAISA